MALDKDDATEAAKLLLAQRGKEKGRLDRLDDYLRGTHAGPFKPREATAEYNLLAERSTTNWLPLVVAAVAQALYVEGYRRTDEPDNVDAWEHWQANGLDGRQAAVHRAALTYGIAYAVVLPGDPSPVIRGASPRKLTTLYADPAEDDWPMFALRAEVTETLEGRKLMLRLYDDERVWYFSADVGGDQLTYIEFREHDLGVCPVVRFPDLLDLDGRYAGELEPLIPIQDRINQTSFDLLMTQTFASYKVRTISGMALPRIDDTDEDAAIDQEAARAQKLAMAPDRLLIAEDHETKFGVLDETPLDGFISSLDQVVRHLAAISQTPPHHLLGQMANLSAEALAAAEASLTRKVEERKKGFGEAWEQTLRLAALAAGDRDGAQDVEAQVYWRDTEARSLAATVDALGKATTMLGIPPQALWERIPGVSQTDVERWKQLATENDALRDLASILRQQTEPAPEPL